MSNDDEQPNPDAGWGHDPDQLRHDEAEAAAIRRQRLVHERIDGLDRSIEEIRTRHADLAVTVSERIAPELDNLAKSVASELQQLRDAVGELLAVQQKTENPPVDWADLDAEEAEQQWPILARWIGEVFVPVYEITRDQLPDCWPLHFPAVIELSWLRSAHVQSYLSGTHPHITAEWHSRWRPTVLTRIPEIIPVNSSEDACAPGKHHGQALTDAARTPPTPGGVPPRRMLASPEHWWPAYQLAVHHDLDRRRRRAAAMEQDWLPARLTN